MGPHVSSNEKWFVLWWITLNVSLDIHLLSFGWNNFFGLVCLLAFWKAKKEEEKSAREKNCQKLEEDKDSANLMEKLQMQNLLLPLLIILSHKLFYFTFVFVCYNWWFSLIISSQVERKGNLGLSPEDPVTKKPSTAVVKDKKGTVLI